MNQSQKPEENLADEFHNLGKNIVEALSSAWERPERKQLQQEIVAGLSDLANTLKREVDSFQASPTGQQVKSELEELRERVRSGEAEESLRAELLKALRLINTELEKAAARLSEREDAAEKGQEETN